MSEQVSIQMSQGMEILPPRSGQAYPIPCNEWVLLKTKISRVAHEPWLFHTIGSVLFGAAASALISVLLTNFDTPALQTIRVIGWASTIAATISGILCLIFADLQRKAARERASDVVAQMELIEKRFERAPI